MIPDLRQDEFEQFADEDEFSHLFRGNSEDSREVYQEEWWYHSWASWDGEDH